MFPTTIKHRLATALVGAALTGALAAPGALAHHGSQPNGTPDVPPPPSSIAAPAGEAYSALRSPDGEGGTGEGYVDLRSPDSRNQPDEYPATVVSPTVADEPSEGFDLLSAAIGALAAGGLAVVLTAALLMRKPTARRAASA